MKLKINLEQEMTDEEFDTIYDEFGIDGEDRETRLCFLLKSILMAQLNKDNSLSYMSNKPKIDITIE